MKTGMTRAGALCAVMALVWTGCIFGQDEVPNNTGADMSGTPDMQADMGADLTADLAEDLGEPDASSPDQGVACVDDAGCGDGETCCGGVCARLSDDAANCGACGAVCGEGDTCSEGMCVCGAGKSVEHPEALLLESNETLPQLIAFWPLSNIATTPDNTDVTIAYKPEGPNFALVAKTGPKALRLQLVDGYGARLAASRVEFIGGDNAANARIEKFQALTVPGGVMLFVHWVNGFQHRLAFYQFSYNEQSGELREAGRDSSQYTETPIVTFGAGLLEDAVVLLTIVRPEPANLIKQELRGQIFTQGAGANTMRTELPTVDLAQLAEAGSPLLFGVEPDPTDRSKLMAVATWYGKLFAQTAYGAQYYEIDRSSMEASATRSEKNLFQHMRPAALQSYPTSLLPISPTDDGKDWYFYHAIYRDPASAVEISAPDAQTYTPIVVSTPPTAFGAQLTLQPARMGGMPKALFGWLESATRPGERGSKLPGSPAMRGWAPLSEAFDAKQLLSKREIYEELFAILNATDAQSFWALTSEGNMPRLEQFRLHKGQLICPPAPVQAQ